MWLRAANGCNNLERGEDIANSYYPPLVRGVEDACSKFESRAHGLKVSFVRLGRERPVSSEGALTLFRVLQESLTNVARHAQAQRVVISLEPGRGSVVLRVADDGRGFSGTPTEHGGLRSMRERAVLVDGALAIKPAPEGGVEVR